MTKGDFFINSHGTKKKIQKTKPLKFTYSDDIIQLIVEKKGSGVSRGGPTCMLAPTGF